MSIYDDLDTWPIDLLIATDSDWQVDGNSIESDPSLSGMQRVVRTDGGGFRTCEMTGISLRTAAQIKLARALIGRAQGGVTYFDVPADEAAFAPWPDGRPAPRVPHTDGTTFDDGAMYVPNVIDIEIEEAAALRATRIKIRVNIAAPLIGGEGFSLVHPNMGKRFYLIDGIEPVTDGNDGLFWIDLDIPLREVVVVGQALDFENPSCPMRLTNAKGAMKAIHLKRFSELVLQWKEV